MNNHGFNNTYGEFAILYILLMWWCIPAFFKIIQFLKGNKISTLVRKIMRGLLGLSFFCAFMAFLYMLQFETGLFESFIGWIFGWLAIIVILFTQYKTIDIYENFEHVRSFDTLDWGTQWEVIQFELSSLDSTQRNRRLRDIVVFLKDQQDLHEN